MTGGVNLHVSQPYVRIDQATAWYRRNFRLIGMAFASNTSLSSPHRVKALAVLVLMSCACLASAVKIVPRYLNLNTFLSSSPSHLITGLRSCWSSSFVVFTASSARVPTKFCVFSCLCLRLLCIATPFADEQGRSHTSHLCLHPLAYTPFAISWSCISAGWTLPRGSQVSYFEL